MLTQTDKQRVVTIMHEINKMRGDLYNIRSRYATADEARQAVSSAAEMLRDAELEMERAIRLSREESKTAEEYIDRCGNNYTKEMVVRTLQSACGETADVIDYLKVGGVYSNGGLWWQRVK